MFRRKIFQTLAVAMLSLSLAGAAPALAQKKSKKQPTTTGDISGRVRVDAGVSAAGVSVRLRQGDSELAETTTNAKGEFAFRNVAPGSYGLTLRKAGLQVGRMENVEVRSGRPCEPPPPVGTPKAHSPLVVQPGSVSSEKKYCDGGVTNSYGQFSFRLTSERARYRLTAKADGMEASSQDVEVEGAAIYRAALNLRPASK